MPVLFKLHISVIADSYKAGHCSGHQVIVLTSMFVIATVQSWCKPDAAAARQDNISK